MKTKSKINSIIMSLCEIIVGILLLVNPVGFTSGIIVFLGIILGILGVAGIVQYFRTSPEKAMMEQGLTRGLLELLVGIFFITKNKWFIATFPILTVIYGIGTLVLGITKIQLTVDMIRLKVKKWFWAAISAVITILCAGIILYNPFSSTSALWIFIAIALIVEAVIDIVATIFAKSEDKTS